MQNFVLAISFLAVGMLSGYGLDKEKEFYHSLKQSVLTPPSGVFGIVWTVLYILQGLLCGYLWNKRFSHPLALTVFFVQWVCTLFWPRLFFLYRDLRAGLFVLCLIFFLNLGLLWLLKEQPYPLLLLAPYMLWISFALFLMATIYKKNPLT